MSTSNQFLTKRVQKFTWDQSVDGDLANNASTSIGTLPAGALITSGAIHVVDALDDADDGSDSTVSFGYTGATTDFWAATAVSDLTEDKLLSILPGNPALGDDADHNDADEVAELVDDSWIFLTEDKEVLLTTGDDEAIDEGKLNVFIEYYMSE